MLLDAICRMSGESSPMIEAAPCAMDMSGMEECIKKQEEEEEEEEKSFIRVRSHVLHMLASANTVVEKKTTTTTTTDAEKEKETEKDISNHNDDASSSSISSKEDESDSNIVPPEVLAAIGATSPPLPPRNSMKKTRTSRRRPDWVRRTSQMFQVLRHPWDITKGEEGGEGGEGGEGEGGGEGREGGAEGGTEGGELRGGGMVKSASAVVGRRPSSHSRVLSGSSSRRGSTSSLNGKSKQGGIHRRHTSFGSREGFGRDRAATSLGSLDTLGPGGLLHGAAMSKNALARIRTISSHVVFVEDGGGSGGGSGGRRGTASSVASISSLAFGNGRTSTLGNLTEGDEEDEEDEEDKEDKEDKKTLNAIDEIEANRTRAELHEAASGGSSGSSSSSRSSPAPLRRRSLSSSNAEYTEQQHPPPRIVRIDPPIRHVGTKNLSMQISNFNEVVTARRKSASTSLSLSNLGVIVCEVENESSCYGEDESEDDQMSTRSIMSVEKEFMHGHIDPVHETTTTKSPSVSMDLGEFVEERKE